MQQKRWHPYLELKYLSFELISNSVSSERKKQISVQLTLSVADTLKLFKLSRKKINIEF